MTVMKLPEEQARAIELCHKAGLSDRETQIILQKNYPQLRVVRIQKTNPKTYREIGEDLHLTAEGVRFIHDRAIKKLKQFVHQD